METKNALIESACIYREDNGVLSAYLILNYGDRSQLFGGYILYLPKNFRHHTLQSFAGHFICRAMEVTGVNDWGDLKGKAVRVRLDESGGVSAIGHIINDDWFCPSADFAANASANKNLQGRGPDGVCEAPF